MKDIDFNNYEEALEYLNDNRLDIINIFENWLNEEAEYNELDEFTELIQKIAEYHENNK